MAVDGWMDSDVAGTPPLSRVPIPKDRFREYALVTATQRNG